MAGYYVHADKHVLPPPPQQRRSFSNLEVGAAPFSNLPEVAPSPPRAADTDKIACNRGEKRVFGRRGFYISRQRFYLGLALVILVVIAAVVGTAVGVLQHKKGSDAAESPADNPDTQTTDPANETSTADAIWDQSALGVTGWKYNDDKEYSIRLFYQDAEGYLRISSMESVNAEAWSAGTRFVKAKRGTPLAASCHNQSIYDVNKKAMEAHVFYLDENAKLQEYIFEDNDKTGYNGSLNDQNIVPANNTRLASYWPSLVYQNPDDTISEMRYDCPIGASSCWKSKNLDIKGPGPSAPLAEVPRGRWGTESHLYYQRQDGELVNLVFRNDTEQWTTEGLLQQISLPTSAPLGLLATPRNPNGGLLQFLVLYQKSDNRDIFFAWRNAEGWNAPAKDPALSAAMKGTDIACLAPESWTNKMLAYGPEMSRCFFMGTKGKLREVQWKGLEWKDLGFIRSISNGEGE